MRVVVILMLLFLAILLLLLLFTVCKSFIVHQVVFIESVMFRVIEITVLVEEFSDRNIVVSIQLELHFNVVVLHQLVFTEKVCDGLIVEQEISDDHFQELGD